MDVARIGPAVTSSRKCFIKDEGIVLLFRRSLPLLSSMFLRFDHVSIFQRSRHWRVRRSFVRSDDDRILSRSTHKLVEHFAEGLWLLPAILSTRT